MERTVVPIPDLSWFGTNVGSLVTFDFSDPLQTKEPGLGTDEGRRLVTKPESLLTFQCDVGLVVTSLRVLTEVRDPRPPRVFSIFT